MGGGRGSGAERGERVRCARWCYYELNLCLRIVIVFPVNLCTTKVPVGAAGWDGSGVGVGGGGGRYLKQ